MTPPASDRKLRLFACGCCTSVRPQLTDPRSRAALVATERFADGAVTAEELEAASDAAFAAAEELRSDVHATERAAAIEKGLLRETDETLGIWGHASAVAAPANAAVYASYPTKSNLLWAIEEMVGCVAVSIAHAAEPMLAGSFSLERQEAVIRAARAEAADLFRDVFGNLFRPVTFSPAWRTSTTLALASSMYESRDFGAMPILADALQDMGCECAEVLDHCRNDGPHVRGCWVVDSVLGKE